MMNFELEFTTEDPVLTPIDSYLIDIIDQSEFDGFSLSFKIFGPERRKSLTLKSLTNLTKRKMSLSELTKRKMSLSKTWRRTSDPQGISSEP